MCLHKAGEEKFHQILEAIENKKREAAYEMPDENSALLQMHEAYSRLKDLGWRHAIHCPKDGTTFLAIEAGSTGTFKCHYDGQWPRGRYWLEDAGDLWPCHPILFKPVPPTTDSKGENHVST